MTSCFYAIIDDHLGKTESLPDSSLSKIVIEISMLQPISEKRILERYLSLRFVKDASLHHCLKGRTANI